MIELFFHYLNIDFSPIRTPTPLTVWTLIKFSTRHSSIRQVQTIQTLTVIIIKNATNHSPTQTISQKVKTKKFTQKSWPNTSPKGQEPEAIKWPSASVVLSLQHRALHLMQRLVNLATEFPWQLIINWKPIGKIKEKWLQFLISLELNN